MNNIKFKAAIYLRISKENVAKIESDSISNQRSIIYDYLKSHPEIKVCDEMIDDGFSGTDSDRPEFKRLLLEVTNGSINCIIVKDLSRFSRDYVLAGKYIEKLFPSLGVRFISVTDNIDTFGKNNNDSIIISFKNILNDAYARDASIKIRSSLKTRRENGYFTGAFPVYGYKKDEKDKNKLVIDDFAAAVVKNIFKWKLEGMSIQGIADKLNENSILTPMEYKNSLGMKYTTSFKTNTNSKWSLITVRRILKNEIYTGVLCQGKHSTPNYKVNKIIYKLKEEWAIVTGTHEAIISKENFELVNNLLAQDTRIAPNNNTVYMFAGMLNCDDCKGTMIRKPVSSKGKKYIYYVCKTNKDEKTCSSHRVKEEDLTQLILAEVNNKLDTMPNKYEFIKNVQEKMDLSSGGKNEIFIFDEKGKIKELTRVLLVTLINQIYVTKDKTISIEFNSLYK